MEISTINVTENGVCVEAALFSLNTSEISFQASLTLAGLVHGFSDLKIRDKPMISSWTFQCVEWHTNRVFK